jgi:hypothetical protein
MAQTLILSVQQLIDFANGATIQGITGPGSGYGTSSATYHGEEDALNGLLSNGYLTQGFNTTGYGPMKEYYLSTP